jgi:hypothetical protein
MQQEFCDLILNNEIDLDERIKIVGQISQDVSLKKIAADDIPLIYQVMLQF